MSEQPTTTAIADDDSTPPPFDPDPDLVGDLEGNPLALRAFRKAAQEAHDKATKGREGIA